MIVEALTGWLGVVALVVAASSALSVDAVRQWSDRPGWRARHRGALRTLTMVAVVFAVLGAVSTLLRFAVLI